MTVFQSILSVITALYALTAGAVIIALSLAAKRDPESNKFERNSEA